MCLSRKYIKIIGAVQGVGFRPFVFRLANELNLSGNVSNTAAGVIIEIQGNPNRIDEFQNRVISEAPEISVIDAVTTSNLHEKSNEKSFQIIFSDHSGSKTVTVLPDLALCTDCIVDITDPKNRRFGYSFTNCTNCGPRFSIINDIPYDRPNTEMEIFTMCPDCQSEYENPADRRFHAQPNACPVCGPQISISQSDQKIDHSNEKEIISFAQQSLLNGNILALKGIGGYQLLCDAGNQEAVQRLRQRKMRDEKPFAVMVKNLDTAHKICVIDPREEKLLTSVSAPIVLLQKKEGFNQLVADIAAPDNPYLGVMLPYSPLHYLLLNSTENSVPSILVCTSGNLHDEPIAISNGAASNKLTNIADIFLVHNRPIARQMDDSVIRQTSQGVQYLRRARGFAPFPVIHKNNMPNILSLGAHLKNTIAITFNDRTVLSQHIGDLSNPEAYQSFIKIVDDLSLLHDFKPELIACDLHPDYLSTKFAHSLGLPVIQVQHHQAHIAAVMAEHQETGPVFGISWDGTGLGTDRTIWGGEFLICENGNFERWGHFLSFPLPGGDLAAKEPRRSAMGLIHKLNSSIHFNHNWNNSEFNLIQQALNRKINTPLTSSVGRLFDAVASLLDIRQITAYEGQSAMMLEFCAIDTNDSYAYDWDGHQLDWQPMILGLLKDRDAGISVRLISGKFHNTLVNLMVDAAKRSGLKKIVISGGVFQNKILFEKGISALLHAGFEVLTPKNIPANDGGIALGQAFVAGYRSV